MRTFFAYPPTFMWISTRTRASIRHPQSATVTLPFSVPTVCVDIWTLSELYGSHPKNSHFFPWHCEQGPSPPSGCSPGCGSHPRWALAGQGGACLLKSGDLGDERHTNSTESLMPQSDFNQVVQSFTSQFLAIACKPQEIHPWHFVACCMTACGLLQLILALCY